MVKVKQKNERILSSKCLDNLCNSGRMTPFGTRKSLRQSLIRRIIPLLVSSGLGLGLGYHLRHNNETAMIQKYDFAHKVINENIIVVRRDIHINQYENDDENNNSNSGSISGSNSISDIDRVQLTVKMAKFMNNDDKNIAIGEQQPIIVNTNSKHDVSVVIFHQKNKKKKGDNDDDHSCHQFTLRFVGGTVGFIRLEKQQLRQQHELWTGSFTIPLKGSYTLDFWFYDSCIGKEKRNAKLIEFDAEVAAHVDRKDYHIEDSNSNINDEWSMSTLFANEGNNGNNLWMKASKFGGGDASLFPFPQQQYIWMDPRLARVQEDGEEKEKEKKALSTDHSTLVVNNEKYYDFNKNSNYEIVCFVGSESAEKIRRSFLELRKKIFPHQRPFKFHYYKMNDFKNLTILFDDDEKKKKFFRKCKHILISVDEVVASSTADNKNNNGAETVSISQTEYLSQVYNFLRHLLIAFNDDTFPIWIFTVNYSPVQVLPSSSSSLSTSLVSSMCHTPTINPRTTDHPCNDALRKLFTDKNNCFPGGTNHRVRLLDNTDVSLPLLLQQHGIENNDENSSDNDKISWDIYAVIALRIYTIVGKQVRYWRSHGNQFGAIDGLHRNGKVEPNFDLIPYTDWDNPTFNYNNREKEHCDINLAGQK